MSRYVCIHGHFYQPPRENPWLEEIEEQPSAYPYHDWNSRITAECYGPNAASRILDSEQKIINISNNYSKISFNFGPTLLSWMEDHEPETYSAIINSDRESRKKFSGHGSAIAQCYSHMIMPLAARHDKETQVIWGIRDFEYRFGRLPEGMWLPETAVDLETLDIMAEHGILFTILSPSQASHVRKNGEHDWIDVTGSKIDPKMPYNCMLPSGRSITIFFYDGPAAQDLAFGNLLRSGTDFANRLIGLFNKDIQSAQIVHIASDGETYGHHHKFGEMSLAYCLQDIESNSLAEITIYGEYLEKFPPHYEVKIIEQTAWSCAHGVCRWNEDCGCNLGINPKWNQKWRKPLRDTFDWLRDELKVIYENKAGEYLKNPWEARNDYIDVVLNRSDERVREFFSRNVQRKLTQKEKIQVIELMEMQRYAMLMYTSCGWFFDEVSGIETVQIIQYAVRALQLAQIITGKDLETEFLRNMEKIPSNIPAYENGRYIYEAFVKPAMVDFLRAGAHYAVSSLFAENPEDTELYSYSAEKLSYDVESLGKRRFASGAIKLRYELTKEESAINFVVVHLGDHNLLCGVMKQTEENHFSNIVQEIREVFHAGNLTEIIRVFDKHFGSNSYSLWHLFKDEQIRIMRSIFNNIMTEKESFFHQIKNNDYPMLLKMKELNIHFPKVFTSIIEHVLSQDIRKLLKSEKIDLENLRRLVNDIKRWNAEFDKYELAYIMSEKIDALIEKFMQNPKDIGVLEEIKTAFSVIDILPLDLNLWKSQNMLFTLSKGLYEKMLDKKEHGNKDATSWVDSFIAICSYMKVRVE